MIDEKAKEKINDILNKNFNITPKQIAEAYLAEKKWKEKLKKNIIPEKTILGSLFLRKTTFPELFITMVDYIEKRNIPLPKGWSELKDVCKVELETSLKSCVDQLSKKTRKQLEDNYDFSTTKKVLESIVDFETPIIFSIMAKDIVNKFIKIANDWRKKEKTDFIKACHILACVPLSNYEREIIQAIKHRLKSPTYIEMTPLKEMEMYKCLFPLTPFPSPKTPEETLPSLFDWFSMRPQKLDPESLVYVLQFNYKRKRGCPRDIFFVALQMVIYTLLALENQPKKIKEHGCKKWAQKLSFRIIKESYKRWIKYLPKLTEKSINNAIYLKNTY